MGLATALGGDNPFGVRLVSAVAGAATVLGVWWLGRRMYGPRGGRLAALIWRLRRSRSPNRSWRQPTRPCHSGSSAAKRASGCSAAGRRARRRHCSGCCLSLATLTKGPIGPALIAASSLLAWWWGWPALGLETAALAARTHRLRDLDGTLVYHDQPGCRRASSCGSRSAVRSSTGWPPTWNRTAVFPAITRLVSALVFYPWSALLPAALAGAWMRRKSDPNLGFLLGWAIGPLLLLECFRTKLIHYYLPAIPRVRPLTAWLVLSVTAEGVNIRRRPLGRLAMALLVGIALVGIVLLVAGTTVVPGGLRLAMLAGCRGHGGRHAGGSVGFSASSDRTARSTLLAATWAVVMMTATGWLIPLGSLIEPRACSARNWRHSPPS